MNKTLINKIRRLDLTKIVISFLLFTTLFLTTAFGNNTAIAAGNKSETTYPTNEENLEGLLYSDSDKVESLSSVDDFVSPQRQKELLDPTQIPAKKQPILDRSNPDAKLLEKTKQMFDDAANFSAN
ncbi:MAG: hypothetical protein QNJ72_44400 [Pleurocapsa sp. MO_226.B13]|nr:hypothetical protein [Pleurocapsa sp. MO_226.B13]